MKKTITIRIENGPEDVRIIEGERVVRYCGLTEASERLMEMLQLFHDQPVTVVYTLTED